MKTKISELFLYRSRYVIGYSILIIFFIAAIIVALTCMPNGLSQTELDTLKITNELGGGSAMSQFATPDLPLHVMQEISLKLFGVSNISIKLPSAILLLISAIIIFFLLRRWFKPNITVISLSIAMTTGQFIFIGQSASPHILYIIYTSLILLFATLILQRSKHSQLCRIALLLTVSLSLYTPYFWYINLGLFSIALIHPHTRHFLFARKYRLNWLVALGIFALSLIPLIYSCCTSPDFLSTIFGINNLNFDIINNLKTLIAIYFWPEPTSYNGQIVPILDTAVLFIIIFGLMQTLRQRHTARSYMLLIWLVLSLPLLFTRPDLNVMITVPLLILLAVGVETMLNEWYTLFPKNPYARSIGLVFIMGLVSVMTLSGMNFYMRGYSHMPAVANSFNRDLPLVKNILAKHESAIIITTDKEKPLYVALQKHGYQKMEPTTDLNHNLTGTVIVSNSNYGKLNIDQSKLQSIVTNDKSVDADRFYVYNFNDK